MLRANITHNTTYIGKDLDKLNRSLEILETTINSEQFKNAVLNFNSFEFVRYRCLLGQKLKKTKLQTYSNEELYLAIMKGHREENGDSYMDLKLILSQRGDGSAVGETDMADFTTTYRSAFERMNEGQFAAHLTHEWMHTMGFEHSYSNGCDPLRDCYSVPYAIGNIIEIITTGECWYGCKYETLNK